MEIQTERFGIMTISEEEVYKFPRGIPGFESQTSFVIIAPEQDEPFAYLQSVTDSKIVFVIADPFLFYSEYEFELPESTATELLIKSPEQVIVRSIITVGEDLALATINLIAPIVFNASSRLGKQVVLSQSSYTPKQPLFAIASEK